MQVNKRQSLGDKYFMGHILSLIHIQMCIRDRSYIIDMKRRVNCLRGRMGGEGRPSRTYCVDKCATNNCFLKFFAFPGEVRKGVIEFVPSVCNTFESVIWGCDERELNRELYVSKETELYDLNRKYNKWKESLKIYLINNDLIKIIDPIMSELNEGDLTKIPNVDWLYEYLNKLNEFNLYGYNTQNSYLCGDKIERCYIKTRLIFDDGGQTIETIKDSIYIVFNGFSTWQKWDMKCGKS